MHYKIYIKYDGLYYKGWQKLPDNPKTIQETIENAFSAFTGESIHISGSGRTDAGVSAIAQVADFFCEKQLDISSLIPLNNLLPADIAITSIHKVPTDFHSRKSATSKTYAYCVALNDEEKPDVFAARYVYTPHQGKLDLDKMRICANYIIGTHDFSAFTTDKRKDKSHIRTVTDIRFDIIKCVSGKEVLIIKVTGNGFLYNMVRIIAGTLIFAGVGKINPQDIPAIIASKQRVNAGPTLPSNALFLCSVYYE